MCKRISHTQKKYKVIDFSYYENTGKHKIAGLL